LASMGNIRLDEPIAWNMATPELTLSSLDDSNECVEKQQTA